MTREDPVADDIENIVRRALAPEHLEIANDSAAHIGHPGAGGKGHFRLRVVSNDFCGLSPLQRHRLVNELLAPLFDRSVHALSMETLTPDEFRLETQVN